MNGRTRSWPGICPATRRARRGIWRGWKSKGFTQAQFDASGFAVDISDSGIDDGTTMPNHFGLYANGQTNEGSRVIYNRLEGTPNSGSTLKGCDGHGTLNAHIVGGFDDLSGFPFEDSAGYHYGLGVCPYVRLGSSVIFDPDNSTYPNPPTLESNAWHGGARINNNSWGDTGSDGRYNSDSQTYDALVRNADSSTTANHEMVIVFAAGNDGNNGRRTVSYPSPRPPRPKMSLRSARPRMCKPWEARISAAGPTPIPPTPTRSSVTPAAGLAMTDGTSPTSWPPEPASAAA